MSEDVVEDQELLGGKVRDPVSGCGSSIDPIGNGILVDELQSLSFIVGVHRYTTSIQPETIGTKWKWKIGPLIGR